MPTLTQSGERVRLEVGDVMRVGGQPMVALMVNDCRAAMQPLAKGAAVWEWETNRGLQFTMMQPSTGISPNSEGEIMAHLHQSELMSFFAPKAGTVPPVAMPEPITVQPKQSKGTKAVKKNSTKHAGTATQEAADARIAAQTPVSPYVNAAPAAKPEAPKPAEPGDVQDKVNEIKGIELNGPTVDAIKWPKGTTHLRVFPSTGEPVTVQKKELESLTGKVITGHEFGALVDGKWCPLARQFPIKQVKPAAKSKAKVDDFDGADNWTTEKFPARPAKLAEEFYWPENALNRLLWRIIEKQHALSDKDLVDVFNAKWESAGRKPHKAERVISNMQVTRECMADAGWKPGKPIPTK